MAKEAFKQRDIKREALNNKAQKKRDELKAQIKNKDLALPERLELVAKLDKLNRNSSKIRKRNRCAITGRPRGYYRKFGISRIMLRQMAGTGEVPGVIKSSW